MNIKMLLLIFLSLISNVNAQSDWGCFTPSPEPQFDLSSRGRSDYLQGATIRVYLHIITTNASQSVEDVGFSDEQVGNIIPNLNQDFLGTGINFIQAGELNIIPNPVFVEYFYAQPNEMFVNEIVPNHALEDGINIFLLPADNEFDGGMASWIPGNSFIAGSRANVCDNGEDPTLFIDTALMTHGTGHLLGLYHTHHGIINPGWGENCGECGEGSNPETCCVENLDQDYSPNCEACGDYICDTPADPCLKCNIDDECNWINTEDYEDYIGVTSLDNYLSYSNYHCINEFTPDQVNRMLYTIENSPLLHKTLQSAIVNGSEIEIGNNGQFIQFAAIYNNVIIEDIHFDLYNADGSIYYENLISGQYQLLANGYYSVVTDQFSPGISNIQHHAWNDLNYEYRLSKEFNVNTFTSNQFAYFLDVFEISIQSNINTAFLQLEIMDPWWVDPESGIQPDEPVYQPLMPADDGNIYYKIFVDQHPNNSPAFYSFRTSQLVLDHPDIFEFSGWEGENATIIDEDILDFETIIIFYSENEANMGVVSINYEPSTIPLHPGFNLISFFALPEDPSTTNILSILGENAMGLIGEGVASANSGCSGGVCNWVGNIGQISPALGYWLEVAENDELPLTGHLTNQEFVYDLNEGYNMISFPAIAPVNLSATIPDDVEPIFTKIIGEGQAAYQIEPFQWVGSLKELRGKKGYFVYLTQGAEFLFELNPENEFYSISMLEIPESYNYNQSRDQAFYFIETASINGEELLTDDWIVAFHNEGVVGARNWMGNNIDVPVMGADGSNWTDEYILPGEVPLFRIYDASENKDYFALPLSVDPEELGFENMKFIFIETLEVAPPVAPTGVSVEFCGIPRLEHACLSWSENTEPDFDHYRVWSKYIQDGNEGDWVMRTETSDTAWTDFNIDPIPADDKIMYKVEAVDMDDLVSDPSETVTIAGDVNKPMGRTGEEVAAIPEKYELTSIYPNPFNPETTIHFGMPKDNFVDIRVYDLNGREVANVLSNVKPAGYHSVIWNGSNNISGLYIIKMTIHAGVNNVRGAGPEFSAARKVILLK